MTEMSIVPEEKRILLERLNLKTSTNDIERFFTRWGPLSECIVMFDKNTRRSRGYGFICFVWNHHCEQCLEAQPHSIDGVQIEMRQIKDVSSNPIVKYVNTRKILVSFLNARLAVDEIEEYFSKYGVAHVDCAVDALNEEPLYFAYVTFDEVESCNRCINIGEHCINGYPIFIKKVIRREDLKKAEQMERVRAVCEARIQEELEEEAGRKRRYLDRKLRENYATELALLRPPPPPPPAAPRLRETAVEDPTPTSSWVPLLPNEQFQEDSASHLAGYGPQRQEHTQCSTFTGPHFPTHHIGTKTSQWIPLPHGSTSTPSDVVRRYSASGEPFNSLLFLQDRKFNDRFTLANYCMEKNLCIMLVFEMDFAIIATAPLSLSLELNITEGFAKIVHIWKECCHTANRRLLGVVLVSEQEDSVRDHILAISNVFSKNIEIHKFIPKSPGVFSTCAYEASFCLGNHVVEFLPFVVDGRRHPHVSFPYRLALVEGPDQHWNISLSVSSDATDYIWMQKVAFPRLLTWLTEFEQRNRMVSHRLVDVEDYSQLYCEIKNKWGQQIAATWTERTDPQKFVYEDCAIAAYLIAYWKQKGFVPQRFCDIGCGNGLLVHILQKMKVNGYGIDLRQRKIWTKFVGTDLREKTLIPEKDLLSDSDFLIGNHTDELTPWIPIIAARCRSNFFLLPCCPFDFYNRYQKKCGMDSTSVYSSYLMFIRDICLRLGYCVEEDRLKIPSTKRYCFLCTVPSGGLVANVENVISNMLLHTSSSNFVPREKFERLTVLNQSKIGYVGQTSVNTRRRFSCRGGGRLCSLKEIADILSEEEKAQLRDSDGGLQTFLKNQHQIFKVAKGTVSIRNWAEEGSRIVDGKLRTTDCWFQKYHSSGCPLSAEDCSYKH
ncbi:unnamed protein product [Litomosoides sigmodontis]|uniref:Probable tRNA (uracil-O(2)-)-methyltransferase n=1 Tax=Litomosoides sigmodontis TaxID=42156 RepID=A0A3P6T111_LITSI|nr:unnamed protein product [Litomosoides sigmodontis]